MAVPQRVTGCTIDAERTKLPWPLVYLFQTVEKDSCHSVTRLSTRHQDLLSKMNGA